MLIFFSFFGFKKKVNMFENFKKYIGSYAESEIKKKFSSKLTLASSLIMLTFLMALLGFILSIIAISKMNNINANVTTTNNAVEEFIYVNGSQYMRVAT